MPQRDKLQRSKHKYSLSARIMEGEQKKQRVINHPVCLEYCVVIHIKWKPQTKLKTG